MPQSLHAEVLNVVRAEPQAGHPDRYEIHLDLKADPGSDSTRLVLTFSPAASAGLAARLEASPPGGNFANPPNNGGSGSMAAFNRTPR